MLNRKIRKNGLWNKQIGSFDSAFDDIFSSFGIDVVSDKHLVSTDSEIVENENETLIRVLIPGVPKKDVKVYVSKEHLIVEYNIEKNENSSLIKSKFSRKWLLSEALDSTKVRSTLSDGVLEVSIPRLVPSLSPNKMLEIPIE